LDGNIRDNEDLDDNVLTKTNRGKDMLEELESG